MKWTAKKIHDLRTELNLTQGGFSKRLGLTQAYISLLEAGKKMPSMMLQILLDHLKKERGDSGRRLQNIHNGKEASAK